MVKKCFVLHEEVIDVFHEKYHIPTLEKLPFHLNHARILGYMERGKTRNDFFHGNASNIYIKLKNYYAEKSAKQPVYKYRVNIGGLH